MRCRAMAQIGGFESNALSTDSFWAHVASASDNQWRVTEGRVAWVVRQNPAALGNDSFWAVMGQNLGTEHFCWITTRVLQTATSKHGKTSLGYNCYWAKLGEHMPNDLWNDGFAAFLQMSKSAANSEFFWARFRSPDWPAAISAMRTRMVAVIQACRSHNKPVGISLDVLKAHAQANPTQIALSPATAGRSFPICECASQCSCAGHCVVE